MRGDIYELRANPHAQGREQKGKRYAIALQSDSLQQLATVVAAPTSTGSWESSFHPVIELGGRRTRVLVEQLQAIDAEKRLGRKVGRLSVDEQHEVDQALRLILGLF
ncbi:mRNA interferase MazF [Halopolyspora algeriensis]|uniref:mRNA interferase MazF n=1 Tax=Halopolyspora algeriensis TaxID=1500506 RepID=A0A368VPC7_9ACTN|nr:type II toxin-antitoxin system PemK/MazF family toxin [Halopolyspora algeriensis]RCW43579.1 mRNA interferase MazF [Halopolyspora algeriensis]TQM47636.1 mRNA interferase MazF [Halopolyspora algeriensis]